MTETRAYLVVVQVGVIDAICQWPCVASEIVSALILPLAIVRVRAAGTAPATRQKNP